MKKITLIALAVMATTTTLATTSDKIKSAPEERTPELTERHVANFSGLTDEEVKTLEATTRDTKKSENKIEKKSDAKAEKKNSDMSYLSITLTGTQMRKYRNHETKF